jgi:glycosyltransferase involved in cell wall biosynthesis
MRVFAISHSCVADVNQEVFIALRGVEHTAVALLMPANWRSEYTGEPMEPKLLPAVDFPVFQESVAKPGHISLHFYRRLPVGAIRRFAPDIILSTQEPWSLSGLQALYLSRLLDVPFVFQTNQNIQKRYPPPFSWIESASYRCAALALAYSEEARQVMLAKGRIGQSEVVPYATDISRFYPRDAAARRERLGLTGCIVVGYMGRLVLEKGLDTLVAAVKRLTAKAPVKALLVGAGPEEDRLRQQIAAAGLEDRFVFTGVVPHSEAAEYMACMDLFVLPSRTTPHWKEQFGRVLIEALASGAPVVGSDSGQIPHLIRETGGGLVFPEGDEAALAAALEALIADPAERTRLAAVGARTVGERFSCEAVAQRLYTLLSGVARPGAVPALSAAENA